MSMRLPSHLKSRCRHAVLQDYNQLSSLCARTKPWTLTFPQMGSFHLQAQMFVSVVRLPGAGRLRTC